MYKVVCFNSFSPTETTLFLEKMLEKGWVLFSVSDKYFYFKTVNTEKLEDWISVKDRLPGFSQEVIVWRDTMKFQETMMFKSGWWLCTGDGFNDLLDERHNDITHWKPLSKPPGVKK